MIRQIATTNVFGQLLRLRHRGKRVKIYRRTIVLLSWGISLALLSMPACTRPSVLPNPIEQHMIYFVASKQAGSQIWQIDTQGASSHVVYEVYSNMAQPASRILPQQELSLLDDFLASITPTLSSERVYLTPGISNMSLSPDGQKLAWIVSYFGCNTPGAQVGCFGVQNLVSFDIPTKAEHVLWQSSAHQVEEPHLLVPGIESIAWSPDSHYIALGYAADRDVPCSPVLRLVDIQTQEVRDIGIGGSLLTWSPDTHLLASIDCGVKGEVVRIYDAESSKVQKFSIGNLNILARTISWSHQSNQITFTAIPDTDEEVPRARLYVLEVETGNIQEVIGSNESYENPQWSPDGHLIAVDVRQNIGDAYTKLVVLDPKSKSVVAQLLEDRVISSWQWNTDGKSILILLGNYTTSPSLGIFSVETSTLARIPLPISVKSSLPNQVSRQSIHPFTTIPQDNTILWVDQLNW